MTSKSMKVDVKETAQLERTSLKQAVSWLASDPAHDANCTPRSHEREVPHIVASSRYFQLAYGGLGHV